MSDLVPFRGGLANREERAFGREIARLDQQGRFELARIGQQADLQADRVTAVAYVGKRALHEVAMLSQTEAQLAMIVPAAVTRLQGIADITALAIADVVAETVRRVK